MKKDTREKKIARSFFYITVSFYLISNIAMKKRTFESILKFITVHWKRMRGRVEIRIKKRSILGASIIECN